jgi:hypothetical protein
MQLYFGSLENRGKMTNCPNCGLIVEKEEGGCNHMICSKCKYEFCWICGAKYDVDHFNRSNVFGCSGMQNQEPSNRTTLILTQILHLFTIPFTLLLYPVYVSYQAFRNPYNVP